MAIKQDIYWDVGASWGADIRCTTSAGDDIDLSLPGTQIIFWIGTPAQKILSVALGSGVSVDEDDTSIAHVDIAPLHQASAGIQQQDRKLRYEAWVTEPDGAESRQAFGTVYLSAGLAKKYP